MQKMEGEIACVRDRTRGFAGWIGLAGAVRLRTVDGDIDGYRMARRMIA